MHVSWARSVYKRQLFPFVISACSVTPQGIPAFPFSCDDTRERKESAQFWKWEREKCCIHPPPSPLMKPFAHAQTQPPHYADLQSVPMYKAEGISSLISTHRLLIRNRSFKSMRSRLFSLEFKEITPSGVYDCLLCPQAVPPSQPSATCVVPVRLQAGRGGGGEGGKRTTGYLIRI